MMVGITGLGSNAPSKPYRAGFSIWGYQGTLRHNKRTTKPPKGRTGPFTAPCYSLAKYKQLHCEPWPIHMP